MTTSFDRAAIAYEDPQDTEHLPQCPQHEDNYGLHRCKDGNMPLNVRVSYDDRAKVWYIEIRHNLWQTAGLQWASAPLPTDTDNACPWCHELLLASVEWDCRCDEIRAEIKEGRAEARAEARQDRLAEQAIRKEVTCQI